MALIVEDGTGKTDAESYCSVADMRTYCDGLGLVLTGVTDTRCEQMLRQATAYLFGYTKLWKGLQLTAAQALDWPRYDVIVNGYQLESSVIPLALVRANAALAFRALSGPLSPDVKGVAVKKVKLGPLEKEWDTVTPPANSSAPRFPEVTRLLSGLLAASNAYQVPLRRN